MSDFFPAQVDYQTVKGIIIHAWELAQNFFESAPEFTIPLPVKAFIQSLHDTTNENKSTPEGPTWGLLYAYFTQIRPLVKTYWK